MKTRLAGATEPSANRMKTRLACATGPTPDELIASIMPNVARMPNAGTFWGLGSGERGVSASSDTGPGLVKDKYH